MAITKKPTAQERASARAVYKDLSAQYKEDRDAAREAYRGARAEARTLSAAERNEMRNKAREEYKAAREKSFGDQRSAYDAYKSSASPKKPQTGQAAPTSGGMKKGGMAKMKKNEMPSKMGKVKTSPKADGVATKGKTKGKMVKMAAGGMKGYKKGGMSCK